MAQISENLGNLEFMSYFWIFSAFVFPEWSVFLGTRVSKATFRVCLTSHGTNFDKV